MKDIRTVDYHTEGEPFRIVEQPPVEFPGETVAERRVRAVNDPAAQELRQFLCYEPRGHADMYGGFIVPPNDEGAHLGVLFWHKDGFSTACGHGTMALGVWAVQSGLVTPDPSGTTEVSIDVPSGRVIARVSTSQEGKPVAVDFVNVPSYVLHRQVPVETSHGEVTADVVYGGAIYAHVPASSVGLSVIPENYTALIAAGREIKWKLNGTSWAEHPSDERLSGIYGTILFDDLGTEESTGAPHQRNITVFADGEVDRSPCGSGTCSRVAALAADGTLEQNQTLVHDSIVNTRFHARWAERVTADGHDAVVPHVTGMAFRTGHHTFEADPADPLKQGFVLR
ncbi:proline racemase family protein [Nesterenkonia sp. MY13]|uniref:Proline racemase family protein n=1 Tax=Nesterenkonia sedimenti TaxID=1463632 RepID=A0A7X8TKG3_9MICC|nr:proline racemase family protein [Nesterenkonia sedimenti]NLS09688.1 proline racemase family protein [Nesterenkonia sedimenti]